MLDSEIFEYLNKHNYAVDAQDCLARVLNTSRQIIDEVYDSETGLMTLTTPDNLFVFKWVLGKP